MKKTKFIIRDKLYIHVEVPICQCFHSSWGTLRGSLLPFAWTSIFAAQNVSFDVFSVYLFQKVSQSLFSAYAPAAKLDFLGKSDTAVMYWAAPPQTAEEKQPCFCKHNVKSDATVTEAGCRCLPLQSKCKTAERRSNPSEIGKNRITYSHFFHYVAFRLHSQVTSIL